jgi:hypothetical protein
LSPGMELSDLHVAHTAERNQPYPMPACRPSPPSPGAHYAILSFRPLPLRTPASPTARTPNRRRGMPCRRPCPLGQTRTHPRRMA